MKIYKLYLCFIILTLGFGCTPKADTSMPPADWKLLDLGTFKITAPADWKYEAPGKQEDSFVGQIIGPGVEFEFDCSEMGYANGLIETEHEYLDVQRFRLQGCPTCPPDSDFTENNSYLRKMVEKPMRSPEKVTGAEVKFLELTAKQHLEYPKANYIANITSNGKTIYTPIYIPQKIKSHNIVVDTSGKYVVTIISPKIIGKGMTGIYIHSKSSTFNFQMHGQNLSAKNQDLALLAFKTITFKR